MAPLNNTLRALADPTRCKILEILQAGSRSVSDLAQHFSMTRPAVSKHLAILRQAELVTSHRQGRQQIYELDAAPLGQVREWLDGFDTGSVESRSKGLSAPRARRPAADRGDWRSW